ncbi:unnamed protein product [Scytosiphon promiscuus]
MLHRVAIKSAAKALASTRFVCAPRRSCLPDVSAVQHQWTSTRGLSDSSAAAAAVPAPEGESRKPDWAPGTPAPGREQTVGEAFAAMQYHARGTRKVKAQVLESILQRINSEEELKYASLGLTLFKTHGIDLQKKTATMFIKACCRAGSPQTAVDALAEAGKNGMDRNDVVSARRFNYLLSQLYKAGDTDAFTRAVADARSRQQPLNTRSHTLIDKFEGEERAKEEEAARVQAEEERIEREAEEKAKREEEELLAKAAAEEEAARLKEEEEKQRAKEEEELKAKEAEASRAAEEEAAEAAEAAAAAAAAAAEPGDGETASPQVDGNPEQGSEEAAKEAEAKAEPEDGEAKR